MSTTKKGKALRPSFLHDFTSVISSRIKYVSKFIFSTPYRYYKPVCSTELFRGLTVPCTLPYGQNRCGNNIRLFVGPGTLVQQHIVDAVSSGLWGTTCVNRARITYSWKYRVYRLVPPRSGKKINSVFYFFHGIANIEPNHTLHLDQAHHNN
jgi:hypothetical protein